MLWKQDDKNPLACQARERVRKKRAGKRTGLTGQATNIAGGEKNRVRKRVEER